MTENYLDIETAWDANAVPPAFESAVVISAWTTDAEIAAQAASLEAVYGDQFEIDTVLRLFRAQLRAAAMTTEAVHVSEAATIAGNLSHAITAATTDADLRALVVGVEAGVGGPVDGLYEELVVVRDSRRDEHRVFVSETGAAPRIGNLDGEA